MPYSSMNSAQHFNTIGTTSYTYINNHGLSNIYGFFFFRDLLSRPELSKCSPRSQPKTRSFKMPDCFSLRRDGLDKMKLLFMMKTNQMKIKIQKKSHNYVGFQTAQHTHGHTHLPIFYSVTVLLHHFNKFSVLSRSGITNLFLDAKILFLSYDFFSFLMKRTF